MAAPEPPYRPLRFAFVLILAACVTCAVLAVILLVTTASLVLATILGWLFVALALYFAAQLVP